MTIRKLISLLMALVVLLPSASGATWAVLAPSEGPHACCPSAAAGPADERSRPHEGVHDDEDAECGGQCGACTQCTGPALPVSPQAPSPAAPSAASGRTLHPFLAFFPPVEPRPPRLRV